MIPKIFHRIWFGSAIPAKFEDNWLAWQRQHPEYEFKTWTDQDIQKLTLTKNAISKAKTLAGKSDLARIEIMHRYGGFYLDTDFIPYQYEKLPEDIEFLVCSEDGEKDVVCSNGFIGSIPQHPIWLEYYNQAKIKINRFNNPVAETGPRTFREVLNSTRHSYLEWESAKLYPYNYYEAQSQLYLRSLDQTVGIHIWNGSWFKEKFNKPKALGPLRKSHDIVEVLDRLPTIEVDNIGDILSYIRNIKIARTAIYDMIFSNEHNMVSLDMSLIACFEMNKILQFMLSEDSNCRILWAAGSGLLKNIRPVLTVHDPCVDISLDNYENQDDIKRYRNFKNTNIIYSRPNKPYDAIIVNGTEMDKGYIQKINPKFFYLDGSKISLSGYRNIPETFAYLREDLFQQMSKFLFINSGIKIFHMNHLYL